MKRLLWFCAGILVGVSGTFLYQMRERPAEPKVVITFPPNSPDEAGLVLSYMVNLPDDMPDDELAALIDAIREQMRDQKIRT